MANRFTGNAIKGQYKIAKLWVVKLTTRTNKIQKKNTGNLLIAIITNVHKYMIKTITPMIIIIVVVI